MKFKLYMTLEDYEKWNSGEEVFINNLPESNANYRNSTEMKIEILVDEKDIIDIQKGVLEKQLGPSLIYYTFTLKSEKGPRTRYL